MERDILNCLCMISNYAEMIPGTGLFCCNLTLKNWTELNSQEGLPRWLSGKESTCDAGDSGLIPGSERSPGVGNGNPLQYSCLRNPMDRGVWWATVHGVTKVLGMTERLKQRLSKGYLHIPAVVEGFSWPRLPAVVIVIHWLFFLCRRATGWCSWIWWWWRWRWWSKLEALHTT